MRVVNYKMNYFNLGFNKKLFFLVAFLSTILTIDFNAQSGYEYQFLLPLSYFVSYILAPPIKNCGIGYLVLNGVWLIRYCVCPVLIRLSDYKIRYYSDVTDKDLYIALFLMIVELWLSIFTCYFFYNKGKKNCKDNMVYDKADKINKKHGNISFIVILVMLILTTLVVIFDRNALNSFNFILNNNYVSKGNSKYGISILIISWTKMLLTVFLLSKFADKERQKHNPLNIILSICMVIISISLFSGMSRNEIFIEAFAYISLLLYLFPQYKKQIFIVCFSSLVIVLLLITVLRFFYTRNIVEGLKNYRLKNIASMLNVYFAGQQNVAIGIKSLRLYRHLYNIMTIFKDLLANTIFFNRYVSNIMGTVEIFNLAVYGHSEWADQIPPMITQSFALFNILCVFILIFLMYFILKTEKLILNASNAFGVYVFSFISINLALYSPGNITILFTAFTNRFIPLLIMYKLSLIRITK